MSYSAAYDPETAVVQKGDVVSMATEAVGEGRVYACGTVFCSNFEVLRKIRCPTPTASWRRTF